VLVARADIGRFAQLALPFGRLGSQDVAQKRALVFEFSRGGLFEPLGCRTVGFHLWHNKLLFSIWPNPDKTGNEIQPDP